MGGFNLALPSLSRVRDEVAMNGDVRRSFGMLFGDPDVHELFRQVQEQGQQQQGQNPMAGAVEPQLQGAQPGRAINENGQPGEVSLAPEAATAQPRVAPVMLRDEYAKANPPVLPARPTQEYDSYGKGRRAGLLAFQGLQKFGAALNHVNDTSMDDFYGTVAKVHQQQKDYDANLPALRDADTTRGYNNYLSETSTRTGIDNTRSLIQERGADRAEVKANRRAAAIEAITQDWRANGKKFKPEAFQASAMRRTQGLLSGDDVQAIMRGETPQAQQWKEVKGAGNRIIGLLDPTSGEMVTDPAKLPPEGKQVWDSYKQSEKAELDEQVAKESRMLQRQYALQDRVNENQTNRTATVAERQIRAQYLSNPIIKDFMGKSTAYGTLKTSYDKKDDIAFIYSYMKMLDPGSTVREGEYANARNGGSVPEGIMIQYNKLLDNKKGGVAPQLPDSVRNAFLSTATGQLDTSLQQKKAIDSYFASGSTFLPDNLQGPTKVAITNDHVKQFAQQQGISEAEARKQLEAAGATTNK